MSVRTALSVLGRTVWAGVVLALGAGVVVGATYLPGESPRAVEPLMAEAPPSPSVLVCPGPLRLATERDGEDVAYDSAFDPAPADASSDVVVVTAATREPGEGAGLGAAPAELGPVAGGDVLGEVAAGVEAGVLVREGTDAGLVARAAPVGDAPPWAAAAVTWRAGTGDLRGLAAASCQRPGATTWLVGGSTVLGSSARLVVQNPGQTPATVSLRLWGARGPVELAGAPDHLVAPGGEKAVLLEGLAAEQGQVVVEVTATGGLVTAYLQDSRVDGLVAAGVDLVVGGAGPATELAVPAVSVTEDDPAAPVLRVLAPGEPGEGAGASTDVESDAGAAAPATAVVHLTVLGPDGPVDLPGTEDLVVEVGRVLDVPLDGLPPGDYTAYVSAEVPVVAGVEVSRTGRAAAGEAAPVDRAWSPAVAPGAAGPLAVPGPESGRLVLAALPGGSRPVTAEVVALDEAGGVLGRREVRVPADSSVSIGLRRIVADAPGARPAAVVVRTEEARLAWGVVLDTGRTVAVLAPVAQQTARPALGVTVR